MSRLMVALDYASRKEMEPCLKALSGLDVVMKVGLELFIAEGPDAVKVAKDAGFDVFLDLKLYDIPNTVASAVKSARHWGADYLTVHLSGGRDMLEAASAASTERIKLLGVSVLTSFTSDAWNELGFLSFGASQLVENSVRGLVRLGKEAKIPGTVSSAFELAAIREVYPQAFCVVPGVRPAGEAAHDQARVVTPAEAVALSADAIVVGRPITRSASPRDATQKILAEMAQAR